MSQGNHFARLEIAGWRQFRAVNIKFHPRLTVLTGANGAGKSTILNILSMHLGLNRPYLGVPTSERGAGRFFTGLFRIRQRLFDWLTPDNAESSFGRVRYSNGTVAQLMVPAESGVNYHVSIHNQQSVLGFHMPSHRQVGSYRPLQPIPLEGFRPRNAFQTLINETYSSYLGNHTGGTLLDRLKFILSCWAAIGEGNSVLAADSAQLKAYEGFVEILRKVLPPEIGFIGLSVRPPDIVIKTKTGSFLLEAASGGLTTLVEIAALIYTCSLQEQVEGQPFVVTFDEPENHLHPSLQRSLMPTLLDAFPMVQFIIATHSPFMVSPVKSSAVYALSYVNGDQGDYIGSVYIPGERQVESIELDYENRAGTAADILRDVLGVPITVPQWVETDLREIVARFEHEPITPQTIATLKSTLRENGLSEFFSQALGHLGDRLDRPA